MLTLNVNQIFINGGNISMDDLKKSIRVFEANSITRNPDGSFEIQGFKSDPNNVDAELKMLTALGFNQPIQSKPKPKGIKFSELAEKHLKHAQPNPKLLQQDEAIYQIFIELFDDPYLSDIDHMTLTNFVEIIQNNIPSNAKKTYPTLTAKQISKLNHSNKPMMSSHSVNKYLGRIGVVFKYGVNHGLIDANYAEGKRIKNFESARDKKRPFTNKELNNLFGKNNNNLSKKPDLYWLLYIGSYSGMRLSEICQLQPQDIRQVDGTWVFDINNNHKLKSCKTSGSKRFVPIHAKLLGLDFINFVDGRKNNEFLFGWGYHDKNGWAHYSGKSANNFIKKTCGISEQSFHCFRHTVADCLMKNRTVSKEVQEEILGHAHEGQSYGRYGKGFSVEELYDAIDKLDY
ncbi:MAG: site-specific integrase [Mariprofundaceae bacterium]|nr:site-specific integrase [Mariprofundaceae bacterium]